MHIVKGKLENVRVMLVPSPRYVGLQNDEWVLLKLLFFLLFQNLLQEKQVKKVECVSVTLLFLMCWDDWCFYRTEVFKCWNIETISFMGKSTVFLSCSGFFFLVYSTLWLMFCIWLFFFTLCLQSWMHTLTAVTLQHKCDIWDVLFCRCSLHIVWKTFKKIYKQKQGEAAWDLM